jgi:cysteinyl-tRNA synthetase
MTLRLFNTMSRRVEAFTPLDPGRVSLYTCGPTVYNYAHIGNFRTFLFEDVLRRWLEAHGYEVFHVMNLTDVDDKTIKGALTAGAPLRDYVKAFIDAFHEDRRYLRILDAHAYPRATEFIASMVALVEGLLAKGIAYRGDDGSVYFAIGRFPAYGRLSRLDTRQLKAGAGGRVSTDEYAKEDARDFVLWKASREDDETVGAAWDAPFGRGRPGWHLECSAMALDLIGTHYDRDVLDIHAGGVDLIFPHHEDEIAQSCAHTGKAEFARVWMHGEFLTMAGTKMSKRFGNILTARDLREEHVDAGTVRTLFATTHYRQKLDFTDEALAAAREGSRRLGEFDGRMRQASRRDAGDFDRLALVLKDEFDAAMDDDLNTPRALAALFEAVRAGNRALDADEHPTEGFLSVWGRMTDVLQVLPSRVDQSVRLPAVPGTAGVNPPTVSVTSYDLAWAEGLKEQRTAAKNRRDFAESDRIRALLAEHGWEVRDGRDGTTVQRK